MPTIKDKLFFNFDNKWSNEYNLIHVNIDNSMFEETFIASRDIVETKIKGNDKPYFSGIESSPLEFDLNLAFNGSYTEELIDNIIRWLFVDYYKPLYFEGIEGRIFYCIPIGEPKIIHNGLMEGYISLRMRCNSSQVYSPMFLSEIISIRNGETKVVELKNDGHFESYPEISIFKIGNGAITVTNHTNNGIWFKVDNILNGEDIYINSEKEIIETDAIGKYLYESVTGDYFSIVYGVNRIEIQGDCDIQFRYQLKYRF